MKAAVKQNFTRQDKRKERAMMIMLNKRGVSYSSGAFDNRVQPKK